MPTDYAGGESATGDIRNALQMLVLLHDELAPDGQQVMPEATQQTLFGTLKAVEARLRNAVLTLQRLKHDAPMWQVYYLMQQLERWL